MSRALLLCVVLLCAGCIRPAPQPVPAAFCELAAPIYWDDEAQLDATPAPIMRRVYEHNALGERLCGW